jgi:hypothetical protein
MLHTLGGLGATLTVSVYWAAPSGKACLCGKLLYACGNPLQVRGNVLYTIPDR